MRLLITGGCGFLGAHLVEHFLKNTDWDIVILDKMTYASTGFDRLRDIRSGMEDPQVFTRRVLMLGCDLSQPIPDGIAQELGDIDYVIHAAAESHVDNSITNPLPFLLSNVVGTHHLLMSDRVRHAKRVFLVSTDEVYGPAHQPGYGTFMSPPVEVFHDRAMDLIDVLSKAGGAHAQSQRLGIPFGDIEAMLSNVVQAREQIAYRGFHEYAPFRPANPYAASKAGAEAIAMAYANTYRLPVTIVNTMNLIGERQHPEKFVPKVIRKVLTGETVLIHADPTCTYSGTRFYLHCRTYANALHWLIQRTEQAVFAATIVPDGRAQVAAARASGADHGFAPGDVLETGPPPLKLHVCGERELANLELAEIIAGYVGKPLHHKLVDFHSSRPGHDLRYAMDDSKIRQMGWERPMNLEESLRKTVAWYLAHSSWLNLN